MSMIYRWINMSIYWQGLHVGKVWRHVRFFRFIRIIAWKVSNLQGFHKYIESNLFRYKMWNYIYLCQQHSSNFRLIMLNFDKFLFVYWKNAEVSKFGVTGVQDWHFYSLNIMRYFLCKLHFFSSDKKDFS